MDYFFPRIFSFAINPKPMEWNMCQSEIKESDSQFSFGPEQDFDAPENNKIDRFYDLHIDLKSNF